MFKQVKKLDKINDFQLFCLESYRSSKEMTGLAALEDFKRAGVFEFLSSGFEVLHTQGRSYIISIITDYIQRRQ
jgi:hypothetical protein